MLQDFLYWICSTNLYFFKWVRSATVWGIICVIWCIQSLVYQRCSEGYRPISEYFKKILMKWVLCVGCHSQTITGQRMKVELYNWISHHDCDGYQTQPSVLRQTVNILLIYFHESLAHRRGYISVRQGPVLKTLHYKF